MCFMSDGFNAVLASFDALDLRDLKADLYVYENEMNMCLLLLSTCVWCSKRSSCRASERFMRSKTQCAPSHRKHEFHK